MSQRQRERTANEIDRLIKRHFVPILGRKPLAKISTQDLAEIVDRILSTPSECSHAFAAARIMFRWAEKRRLIDRSPMDRLPMPTKAVARDRVLADEELTIVFGAARDDSTYSKIVRLQKARTIAWQWRR